MDFWMALNNCACCRKALSTLDWGRTHVDYCEIAKKRLSRPQQRDLLR